MGRMSDIIVDAQEHGMEFRDGAYYRTIRGSHGYFCIVCVEQAGKTTWAFYDPAEKCLDKGVSPDIDHAFKQARASLKSFADA